MSDGSALTNVQKILRGSPRVDEVELELLRSRSLKRLAALTDQERTESAAAADVTTYDADAIREAALIEALGPAPEEALSMAGADQPPEPSEPPEPPAEPDDDAVTDATQQAILFPVDHVVEPLATDAAAADAPSSPAIEAEPVMEAEPVIAIEAEVAPAQPATAGSAYCPYCATTLAPAPEVSRRCTVCRQRIVVKHLGNRTVYLAEAAVPVFEAEQRRLAAAELWDRARHDWLDLALEKGAPADRVAKAAAEPPSEARVDAARSLYLTAVDRSFEADVRRGRWKEAAQLRYDEALILFGVAGVSVPAVPVDVPVPVSVPASKAHRSRVGRKQKP